MRSIAPQRGSTFRSLVGAVAVLCFASLSCSAQRYSFREYTQGLGNLNIACLAQDRTGYLWVGTQNGLYRYDGSQFQSMEHRRASRADDPKPLHRHGRHTLGGDLDGHFLRAEGRKVCRDPSSGKFEPDSAAHRHDFRLEPKRTKWWQRLAAERFCCGARPTDIGLRNRWA